jgi:hypothetical protein
VAVSSAVAADAGVFMSELWGQTVAVLSNKIPSVVSLK